MKKLLTLLLLAISLVLVSCDNFMNGSRVQDQLEQLIDKANAKNCTIVVSNDTTMGSFLSSGDKTCQLGYSIEVQFNVKKDVYIYKGLTWKGVWKALSDCVDTLSIVLILISTSSIFGYCLTRLHVPDLAATAITTVSSNPIVIALLLNLILLILGCIMDMAPIILISTPILLPIATSIGLDPVQYGIIVVLNCGIGLLTPPVGAVLFIGSAIAHLPMEKVVKATLPFYIMMVVALMIITFVPDVALFIPKCFGYVPTGVGVIAKLMGA